MPRSLWAKIAAYTFFPTPLTSPHQIHPDEIDSLPTFVVIGGPLQGAIGQIAGPSLPLSDDLSEVADADGCVNLVLLVVPSQPGIPAAGMMRMEPDENVDKNRARIPIAHLARNRGRSRWFQVKESNIVRQGFEWREVYQHALTTLGSISEGLWLLNDRFERTLRYVDDQPRPKAPSKQDHASTKKFGGVLAEGVFRAMQRLDYNPGWRQELTTGPPTKFACSTPSASCSSRPEENNWWIKQTRQWAGMQEHYDFTHSDGGANTSTEDPRSWRFHQLVRDVFAAEGKQEVVHPRTAEEARRRTLAYWAVRAASGLPAAAEKPSLSPLLGAGAALPLGTPAYPAAARGGQDTPPKKWSVRSSAESLPYFACRECADVDLARKRAEGELVSNSSQTRTGLQQKTVAVQSSPDEGFLSPPRIVAHMLNPPVRNDATTWARARNKIKKLAAASMSAAGLEKMSDLLSPLAVARSRDLDRLGAVAPETLEVYSANASAATTLQKNLRDRRWLYWVQVARRTVAEASVV